MLFDSYLTWTLQMKLAIKVIGSIKEGQFSFSEVMCTCMQQRRLDNITHKGGKH